MEFKKRVRHIWQRAGQQKLVGQTDTHTNLNRCLSTLQMTAIGLGSTIGVGIYVLLGVAIRDYAGPGVILSFLFAGLVVLTNAAIFAEFGSYIPHTGASYTYMYRAVGELAAFLTGWTAIVSFWCSAATSARAWSGFVDSLFNNSIQNFFDEKMGNIDIGPPFSRSLDWTAFLFFLAVTLVVSCNVHCSSVVNVVLAVLTTSVLVFVTVAGPILGDFSRISNSENGGFLPFGFGGVVTGASAAFFAFNGYDSICIAAEEAKDPVKSVPRAILIELLIVTIVYCGASVGTLCLIPYTEIDLRAPIPSAFAYEGITWARYVVTIGPILAITNLSILALYAVSRIAYRMAQDGLLMKQFAYVSSQTKVPLVGVIVFGLLISVIALLLELKDLVRFSVLCMLFQYVVLAPALVSLRAADRESETAQEESRSSQDRGSMRDKSRGGENRIDTEPENELVPLASAEARELDDVDDENGDGLMSGGGRFGSKETRHQHNPPSSSYSYALDGDLGYGLNSEPRQSDQFEGFSPAARNLSVNSSTAGPHENSVTAPDSRVDTGQVPSSEVSQSEDSLIQGLQRNNGAESRNSDFADESHLSEESPQTGPPALRLSSRGNTRSFRTEDLGCFENTRREFFKILTTKRCLGLLVLFLAGLSVQLGLGWEDLKRARSLAVVTTILLTAWIVFLCQVLRNRCGPGSHDGFKVPFVPYVPVLSCFLNMLLLVTAADFMGIIEFAVLILIGFVIYVVMVLMQSSSGADVSAPDFFHSIRSEETLGLLSQEDNDADSEGSL